MLHAVEAQPTLDGFGSDSFLSASTAHAVRPLTFPLFPADPELPSLLKSAPKPVFLSPCSGADVSSAVHGCHLMGIDPLPQSIYISAMLNARSKDGTPRYSVAAVLIPRRSSKTTTIWAELIGKCDTTPGFSVATTAQDGIRARNRFMDAVRFLRRQDFEGKKNPLNRRGIIRTGKGDEAIEWDNGSRIVALPPDESSFRGEGYDRVLIDEAGEFRVEDFHELKDGILPTFDTRPDGGQIILAGTPGKARVGWFWESMQAAQEKTPGIGLCAYFIKDTQQALTENSKGDLVLNKRLLRRIHIGIASGLTTMKVISERFEQMPLERFEREYMCRWPFDSHSSALNTKAWAACGSEMGERPDRLCLAFDVEPDGSSAALVAAWRDNAGQAVLEVLACRPGVDWLATEAARAARKYRTSIGYDVIGANADLANRLQRSGVPTKPMNLRAMYGAAARIANEIDKRNVTHFDQRDLTLAVEGATWRNVAEAGRLFARKASASPVHALVAASEALWLFDQAAQRSTPKIIRSQG